MDIINLLSTSQKLIEVAVDGIDPEKLGWIGRIISWIFNLVSDGPGAFAVGVILFTLALKTIVLPLDIYSRVKMRKQSLLMESMRDDMEKLQKQYENDKNMYNQKVLELQKAHGYNPLSACLPTIVSLVIFMTVFSSFSRYSQYANLQSYNDMAKEYSLSVNTYVLTQAVDANDDEYFLIVATEDGLNNPTTVEDSLKNLPYGMDDDGRLVDEEGKEITVYGYYINYQKFKNYYEKELNNELPENWAEMFKEEGGQVIALDENAANGFVKDFVRIRARAAAARYYRENKEESSLLWIGNIWYPDSMLNKEVPDFSKFSSSITRAASSIGADYEVSYNEVTHDLIKEKDTYNGYFVLIVLAIGMMFLQQFITMRSQKAANELSTADGQGAKTNKMMMIMMPIIFGFFSFFYSAAFSTYMIVNTMYSLISTLIINKIVSVRFDKNVQTQAHKKMQGRAGRKRLK